MHIAYSPFVWGTIEQIVKIFIDDIYRLNWGFVNLEISPHLIQCVYPFSVNANDLSFESIPCIVYAGLLIVKCQRLFSTLTMDAH